MSDKPLEVKGPQDLIDIIPQERITGDILRGHGPRRGGLEHLLKFWRPIMRKPGGFRRCIVILANHPELYPLQPLCAWLHHETTGKWPNEGNHHGGGKLGRAAGRVARRAVPGKRRRRRGKSEDGVEIASWRVYRRLARMDGGITTRPIGGDQNAVAYKAARFVQGLQSVPMPGSFDWDKQPIEVKRGSHGRLGRTLSSIASYFTPGDMSKYRNPIRSAMWGALFPGGGGVGPGGGGIGGGARPSIGGGALRCPTGYINGGRFTDPKLGNCGGLVFDVPAKGPGSVTAGDVSKMTRRFESVKPQDVPDVVRDVVVKKPKGDPFAVVREAAIRPNRAGSPARRDSVVNDVVDFVGENVGTTRLVRRDGVVYEPTLTAEELVKMKGHDAIKGAVYVTSKIGKGAIAGDEIRLLSKGAEAIEYAFGQGSVRVERKKDIPVGVGAKMRTRWASISRDPNIIINPFAHVEKFVQEFPEFVEIKPKFKDVKKPNERIVVTSSDGQKRVVSRWIHHMFLSPRAPRRLAGVKPYNITNESGTKTLREPRLDRRQYAVFSVEKKNLSLRPDLSDQFGKPSLADLRISDTNGMSRDSLIELKAARFVLAKLDEDMAVKVFGRRRMRGVRLSRFARRIPKVVPYNPKARDADGDGLVQEGTIWERPSGTIFRGLKAGARKLAGSVQLVDGDGKRVDYKPGENQRSPLRTSRFDPLKRRVAGASERFGGRREQGIRRRDQELDATADFTEVELRRQARKARRQRALAKMRERGAGVRERRTQRMERGAERDEAAAGRHAERATELTGERRDRDEFDRSRRGMRDRQRAERDELDEENPRRERRTQRRDERRRRMQERLAEFGERREEGIRREDRRRGARADFGKRGPSIADRAAAAAERFRERREEGIRAEDRRRGARADFGKLDREREGRRRDRRGPTRRSERTEGQQRGRVAEAADRFRRRNEEAIRRRDRREGAQADFGKLDRERAERRERRQQRREGRGRGLAEATERFRDRREEGIRRRDREEGAVADFGILEREREARQAARTKRELDRQAVRSQRRERIRRRVETFGERQEAAIRLRDRDERAIADFSEIELRREMRRQRVRDFVSRVREINADRTPETREAGRKAARARNDRSAAVSRRFDALDSRVQGISDAQRAAGVYDNAEVGPVADGLNPPVGEERGEGLDTFRGIVKRRNYPRSGKEPFYAPRGDERRLQRASGTQETITIELPDGRTIWGLNPMTRADIGEEIQIRPWSIKWTPDGKHGFFVATGTGTDWQGRNRADLDAERDRENASNFTRWLNDNPMPDAGDSDAFNDWFQRQQEFFAGQHQLSDGGTVQGMPDGRAEEDIFGQTLRSLGSDKESLSPRAKMEEIDTLIAELNDTFSNKYWDLDANGYNVESGLYMHSRFADPRDDGAPDAERLSELGGKYNELISEREYILGRKDMFGRLNPTMQRRLDEIADEIENLYNTQTLNWQTVNAAEVSRFEEINKRLDELGRPALLTGGNIRGMPSVDEMVRAERLYDKSKARRDRLRKIRDRRLAGEETDPAEIFNESVQGMAVVNTWQESLNDRVGRISAQARVKARRERLEAIRERRVAEAKARDADFDPDSIDPDEWHDEGSPEGGIFDLDQAIMGMPSVEEMVTADRVFERGLARRARLREMRKQKEAEAREVRDAGVSPALVDQPIQNLVPTPNDSDLPGEDVLIRYSQGDQVKVGSRIGTVIRSDPGDGGRGAFYVVQFDDGKSESFPMYRVTGDSDLRRRRRAEGVERHFYPDGAIPVEDFTSQGLVDEMAMIKERWDGADVIPVEDMIRFDSLQIAWHEKNPGKDLGSVRNSRGYPVDIESVEYGDGTRASFGGGGVGGDLNSQMVRGMPSVEQLLTMPPDTFDPDLDIDPDVYHDDPDRPGAAGNRIIRSLSAAVVEWLGEDYFDAFEDHELDKAMSDALLLIRAKNGGDLRFADFIEPSEWWPQGFLHAELTLEELFTREGIEKGLLAGVYDRNIPEGVLLELENDHGWERDPIERVQAIVDAVLFHSDEMNNPEVFFENVKQVHGETLYWDGMMAVFRLNKIHEDNVSSREGKIRLALTDRFLEERRSENIRRRNALTASLEDSNSGDGGFEPQGDADEVDVPDSDKTFLQKIVDKFTFKRVKVTEREYERRGKGPDSMPGSFEELGIDVDEIIARGSTTPEEQKLLKKWVISTFSLGSANEFAGADDYMWRLRSEIDGSADLPEIGIIQIGSRIQLEFHASIEFKPPEDFVSRGTTYKAGEWHVSGKTDRQITIRQQANGDAARIEIDNKHMYVDSARAGVKGKGFATFYNTNAWLHVNQLGGPKSTIRVDAADDGEVVWGIQGFNDPHVVANAMAAIFKELSEYKRTGKPGLIRDDAMFETLSRLYSIHSDSLGVPMNEELSPVTLGMIHSVLRGDGKHPWEEIPKAAISAILRDRDADVDAVEKDPNQKVDKKNPTQNGMVQNAYGNWWMVNAPFLSGAVQVHRESAVGKGLDESAKRIKGDVPDVDVDTPDSPRRRNRAAERRAAGKQVVEPPSRVPLQTGRRRASSQLSIGEPDELGRLRLVSTSIEDSDIKTPAAAAEHIRGGGKLSDVPRELILEAVLENSSGYNNDAPDDSKLFRLISVDENGNPGKSSNPGTYGTSYIFLKKDGEPGAEQGFIIKSPDYAYESRGDAGGADGVGGSIANVSQFNEIIGRSISQLMGDPTGGVMLDGTDDSGQPYIVMEFNNVVADIGHEIPLGYMNLEERTRPEMLKSRLRALLIGYSMGLGDRHGGNLLVGSEDAAASSARGVTNIDFQRAWGADTDIRAYIDGHMAEGDGFPGLGLLGDLRTAIREGKLSESELALVIDEVHEQMRQIKDVHLENIFSELSSIHKLGARSRPPTAPSTGPQDVEIHASAVNDHLEMTLSVLSGGEMLLSELLADTTDEDQWFAEGQQF